ncbi:uncharacterized protein LOC120359401 [Solenopsis invicta]|nr:uncharacterized protein LOC120359401 [Solenopsis invicta]XP_039312673.1 uncharacterized protein LOC120359401 [Solenopsis invicta]
MDQEIHFRRLQNNENLMIVQQRKNKERNLNIFQAQTDLITGRLPLEQFLRMFTGIYKTSYYQEHINMQEKENVANILSLENENEENYEKETQITTNQDIPTIICEPDIQPQVVLTRLKRKDYEKYIENDRQPLNFIENTISSNITRKRCRRKVHKCC